MNRIFILTVTSVYDDSRVHCDAYASVEGVRRKIKELVVSKNDEEMSWEEILAENRVFKQF